MDIGKKPNLTNKVTIAEDCVWKKNYVSLNILKTNSRSKENWYLSVSFTLFGCLNFIILLMHTHTYVCVWMSECVCVGVSVCASGGVCEWVCMCVCLRTRVFLVCVKDIVKSYDVTIQLTVNIVFSHYCLVKLLKKLLVTHNYSSYILVFSFKNVPYLQILYLVGRIFASGPSDEVQSKVESYQKTKKIVLDASLFNTQH